MSGIPKQLTPRYETREAAIRVFFRGRFDIFLEVLALRQQVAVLKRKRARPLLNRLDRFVLDDSAAHMAAMVGCPGPSGTGDRGRMASCGPSLILALAFAVARWPTQGG